MFSWIGRSRVLLPRSLRLHASSVQLGFPDLGMLLFWASFGDFCSSLLHVRPPSRPFEPHALHPRPLLRRGSTFPSNRKQNTTTCFAHWPLWLLLLPGAVCAGLCIAYSFRVCRAVPSISQPRDGLPDGMAARRSILLASCKRQRGLAWLVVVVKGKEGGWAQVDVNRHRCSLGGGVNGWH